MMLRIPEIVKRTNFARWLDKAESSIALVGESAVELIVTLLIMVMVERQLGKNGLGTFSYLLSLQVFSGFVSDWGVARAVENEAAHSVTGDGFDRFLELVVCASLITSFFCSFFLIGTAALDTEWTQVSEKMAAYFLLALILPVRNMNKIRIAVLQGIGQFAKVARLKTLKRIVLIILVYLLSLSSVVPSYLLVGYLISEIILMIVSRKAIRLPGIGLVWKAHMDVWSLLKRTRKFMLTDELLDTIYFIDFFLLGMFVSSSDLGIYAEASILVRLFLLVPVSIKPVFRKLYCSRYSQANLPEALTVFRRFTSFIFYFHCVLALYLLLFYGKIISFLSPLANMDIESFGIFCLILPGLLFFCSVISQEPVYEAADAVSKLQAKIISVVLLNLVLNTCFIPFAGINGAATATAITMGVYFLRFGRQISKEPPLDLMAYLAAGAALYLGYQVFSFLDLDVWMSFMLVPIFFFICFKGINVFE